MNETSQSILIVDDDVAVRRLLQHILESEGYQVRVADSGETALDFAGSATPDLILLDVQLGGIDGYEVIRQLQAIESTRDVPVIFMSGSAGHDDRVRGLGLGAVDYVSKPVSRDELLARVRNHLELYRLRLDLRRQADDLLLANELLHTEILERQRLETTLRAEQERQKHLATHDTLTSLPNRRSLESAIARGISRADRGISSALLFMDVDKFKECNDSRGHMYGDKVLCAVAEQLAAEIRQEDLVARVGGDEFAALLEGAGLPEARETAQRMRERVRALALEMDCELDLSVGIAIVEPGSECEGLLISADQAMYADKLAHPSE